jgi:hypothetical protein
MDGAGSSSLFNFPTGLTFVEKEQYLVVCDTANNKLRKVSLAGMYTYFSLSPSLVYTSSFCTSSVGGKKKSAIVLIFFKSLIFCTGSVSTLCQIAEPTDVTIDKNGKLYVSTYSNVIVIVARNGITAL